MEQDNKAYRASLYKIILKEHLEDKWSDWFEETTISYKKGKTILTAKVKDQVTLHGLLDRIRDLNLTLLSVECLGPISENISNH